MLVVSWFVSIVHSQSVQGTALQRIDRLELKEAKVVDGVRMIAELYGVNIVVTQKAGQKQVTFYLRDVEVQEAIETLCKITGLWYRRDPVSGTYRIMEIEEYNRDLVVHRNEKTQVFTLRNPNVDLVAEAIANLYGKRVRLSHSGRVSSLANSQNNEGDDSRSGRREEGGARRNETPEDAVTLTVDANLSVDQLAALGSTGAGGNQVSATRLQQLSTQQEPIFVTVVAEHNLVVVRTGDNQALSSIASLVSSLDRQVPQVLLEMKVIDILVGDDFDSVFNFAITDSKLTGDSPNPILLGNNARINGNFVFEFLNDRLKANIEFFERNNRVRVQSTPMVLASNNRPARLFVGEQRVLVTGYETTQIENNGDDVIVNNENIVPQTEVQEVGNTIEITPYINADDTITLVLKQENSTVNGGGATISVVSNGRVLQLPMDTVNTARLEGTVIAKDDFTIAVGGLVRTTVNDQQQRVPGFSDVPGLGKLFTATHQQDERSELILMITPHIIDTTAQQPKQAKLRADQATLQCGRRCRH